MPYLSTLAILDEQGVIVVVNDAWRRFGMANHYEDSNWGVGRNYLGICQEAIGNQTENAKNVAEAIQQLLCGEKDDFQMEYPCHSDTEQRWFLLSLTRFNFEDQTWLVAAHKDISKGTVAEQGLQLRNRSYGSRRRGNYDHGCNANWESYHLCQQWIFTNHRLLIGSSAGAQLAFPPGTKD